MKEDIEEGSVELGAFKYIPVEGKDDTFDSEATGNELSAAKLVGDDIFLIPPEGRLQKIKSFLRRYPNRVIAVALVIANYLYMSSDETCPYFNDEVCVIDFMMPKAPIWILKVSTAALIFMNIILLGLWYRRINIIASAIAIVNVIYLAWFYDNVIDHRRYGQIFGMFLLLILGTLFFIFFLYQSIRKCCRMNKRVTQIGWLTFIILFVSIFYFKRIHNSCRNWDKGFGGKTIDNSVTCQIPKPDFCGFDVIEGFFDFSIFMNCAKTGAKWDVMKKYKMDIAPVLGFPRIEKAPNSDRMYDQLSPYVLNHFIPLQSMDDPAAKDLEIFIDQRNKDKVEMIIDVKRNETLVQERRKIKSQTLVDNFLVIYIDTLSRPASFRKIPKTLQWFEKFYDKPTAERETFQFLKYMSITPYTQNNLLAAFYGESPPVDLKNKQPPPPKTPKPSYAKYLKEAGYITGRSVNLCDTSLLFIDKDLMEYIYDVPFDHEGSPFSCDPSFYDPDSPLGLWQGPFANVRRCLYGKDTFEYVIDYGEKFWKTYSKEKKFLYLEFIDAHESTQEAVTYLDQPLRDFLERMEKNNQLDNTIILFYSDHGLHIPSFTDLFSRELKTEEKALPTMFLNLPRDFASRHRQTLKKNEQKLVSAWQVHELFLSLPEGEQSEHFQKSMIGDLPNLTCQDIRVSNQACYCNYPN